MLDVVLHWFFVVSTGALAVIGGAGPIVAALKALTGLPKPDDSASRKRWFAVLHGLDYLAANSVPIRAQLQALQSQLVIAAQGDALNKQHAVIAEQERVHVALVTALKQEAP